MYLNKLLILKKLQEANTHLGTPVGRKAGRWARFSAQRAQSYILGFRAPFGPIFDLDKTVISLRRACNVIKFIIRSNGHLLFINTNPKYNKIIKQTAICANQSYINHKWIGGFLTNWNHMQNVQQQFQAAARFTTDVSQWTHNGSPSTSEVRQNSGYSNNSYSFLSGAKRLKAKSLRATGVASLRASLRASFANAPRYKKMQKCFEGAKPRSEGREAVKRPDCVIILNAKLGATAVYEAHLNQIPIISLVDSNIPNELHRLITYPIPANYDSVQFIYLFCNCILKTILVS
jgi:ribosomal protein S2